MKRQASPPRTRRTEMVHRIADALLTAGVAQIPLRDLAQLLGTSDRMLLYYFDDKPDLVRSSLQEVSARLAGVLDRALPRGRSAPARLIELAVPLFTSPELAPFMNVWADISARGGRGEQPFKAMAERSVAFWLAWLEDRLAIESAAKRRVIAVAILMLIEGARQVEAHAPGTSHAAATLLAASLARRPIVRD